MGECEYDPPTETDFEAVRECAYEPPTDLDDVRVLRFELLSSHQLSMSNPADITLLLLLLLLFGFFLLFYFFFGSSLITET